MTLRIGTVLHGFCNGVFGRDNYDDKRVEGIGADWIVARNELGYLAVATFDSAYDLDSWWEERNRDEVAS